VSLDDLQIVIDTNPKASGPSGSKPAIPPPPPVINHPLALLLARLWAGKTATTSIELHLGDGKMLTPDEFSRQNPFGSFGLFGNHESNGSHTLTAVSWDSIERITIRGLPQLPEEWFEAV
jgi:hypothetical protein